MSALVCTSQSPVFVDLPGSESNIGALDQACVGGAIRISGLGSYGSVASRVVINIALAVSWLVSRVVEWKLVLVRCQSKDATKASVLNPSK